MTNFKPCAVCGRHTDANISKFCSQECGKANGQLLDFSKDVLNYSTEDKRIFFYDFSFGDLCDLWTTYLIKQTKAKDLTKFRSVDRALERLEKAILTKLNRLVDLPNCPTRKLIVNLMQDLLNANAKIWTWKDKYFSDKYTDGDMFSSDEWLEFLDLYKRRDDARKRLDQLVDGLTMLTKTYE